MLDNWLYILPSQRQLQLRYLDKVSNHAVVTVTTNYVKGSINAVLRRILREGWPDIDSIKRKISVIPLPTFSQFTVSKLKEEYGEERYVIFKSLLVRSSLHSCS